MSSRENTCRGCRKPSQRESILNSMAASYPQSLQGFHASGKNLDCVWCNQLVSLNFDALALLCPECYRQIADDDDGDYYLINEMDSLNLGDDDYNYGSDDGYKSLVNWENTIVPKDLQKPKKKPKPIGLASTEQKSWRDQMRSKYQLRDSAPLNNNYNHQTGELNKELLLFNLKHAWKKRIFRNFLQPKDQ
ncbi:hypothetical protein DASC09_029140 [Saccharomycopsis crataegensis]|uniref:Uncharacterized protein n=1 Tax=Saccharomycopsis crataegensis TaxID=43959 RepID=A0AAV5QLI9_9ASCO|nr:hypothetical protein DASC09_029140 [Saccharomycopsis crataegensis]